MNTERENIYRYELIKHQETANSLQREVIREALKSESAENFLKKVVDDSVFTVLPQFISEDYCARFYNEHEEAIRDIFIGIYESSGKTFEDKENDIIRRTVWCGYEICTNRLRLDIKATLQE